MHGWRPRGELRRLRLNRIIRWLFGLVLELRESRTRPGNEDAIDDDVLDAWLDEDEIGASGL